MSRHGTVLPIPDDPRVQRLIDEWPEFERTYPYAYPRSVWLKAMEELLRELYISMPDVRPYSSRDLNLTARSLAPFPLAEKDWL